MDEWNEYLDTDDEGEDDYGRVRNQQEANRIRYKQELELKSAYRQSTRRILLAETQVDRRTRRALRKIEEPERTPEAEKKLNRKQAVTLGCRFIDDEAVEDREENSPDNERESPYTSEEEIRVMKRNKRKRTCITQQTVGSVTQSAKYRKCAKPPGVSERGELGPVSSGCDEAAKKATVKCIGKQNYLDPAKRQFGTDGKDWRNEVGTDDSFDSDEESI